MGLSTTVEHGCEAGGEQDSDSYNGINDINRLNNSIGSRPNRALDSFF